MPVTWIGTSSTILKSVQTQGLHFKEKNAQPNILSLQHSLVTSPIQYKALVVMTMHTVYFGGHDNAYCLFSTHSHSSSIKLHMLYPVCHTVYRLPLIALTMTLFLKLQ